MARVEAPLMSLDASGSIGGSLVFSRWRGRKYVRTLVTPKNPRSPTQTGMRAMMKFLATYWDAIYKPDAAYWVALAAATNISTFNAYIAHNMRRWRDGYGPQKDPSDTPSSTPGVEPTIASTPQARCASLEIGLTTNQFRRMVAIFRDTAGTSPPTYANCIAVLYFANYSQTIVYVDGPLADGTYYYSAHEINDDGAIGVALDPWEECVIGA